MAELACDLDAAVLWRPMPEDPGAHDAMAREALLLLTALNQLEAAHDGELPAAAEQRRLDRIEAKLDLALYLLARVVRPSTPTPPRAIHLTPAEAVWSEHAPPLEGTRLSVEFSPASILPLTLCLPAIALRAPVGQARARFEALPEVLREALYQFVFRRHRQAIRARGG